MNALRLFSKILSYSLITLSIVLFTLGGYQFWLKEDPNRLAIANYTVSANQVPDSKNIPVEISMQTVGINIPVLPAKVTGTTWPTTDKGASYLLSSPIPGEKGNSVIYGHNWVSLFGKIVNLRKGDEIDITLADKTVKKFKVVNTSVVTPDDTGILSPTGNKQLTLYTCTGFLDSKRFVVRAELEK